MKNTTQAYSRSRVKGYSLGIITAACFASLLPTEASAGCRKSDFICKAKEVANRARDAARRAEDEVRRKADEANAAREAAERFAASEQRRITDETKEAADRLASETKRLEEEAKKLAEKLAEEAMRGAQDLAFGQLKDLGLGVLADTQKFTDPNLWLREITQLVMSDMAGEKVADAGAKAVSYIQGQLGQFSDASPFGSGPVGKQLQAEVEKTYKEAIEFTSVAGNKTMGYMNPLNNPIRASADDFNIAKAMYGFDLPDFTRFSYGTDFGIKPIDVTIDSKDIPALIKGNISTTFPLIWGDNKGATSIFVNAVNDKKFNFSVAAMGGLKTREVQGVTDDRALAYKNSMKFDVTCSIVRIGMCQLTKIAYEQKLELSRKADGKITEKIRQAMGSVITLVGYMKTLHIMDGGDVDKLTTVLRHIESTIDQPLALVDKIDQMVYVADDVSDRALKRHSDIGAITYITAALTAIPDLKYEGKGANFKRTVSLTDNEDVGLSTVYEWYNADAKNGVFKPGFAYVGNNPMADMIGIKMGKGISTEATFKLSGLDPTDSDGNPVKDDAGKVVKNADKTSVSSSISVATTASYGVFLPIKIDVMKEYNKMDSRFQNLADTTTNLIIDTATTSNTNTVIASDTDAPTASNITSTLKHRNKLFSKIALLKAHVIQVAKARTDKLKIHQLNTPPTPEVKFSNKVAIGASKLWWAPDELQALHEGLEHADKLNLATYITISGN